MDGNRRRTTIFLFLWGIYSICINFSSLFSPSSVLWQCMNILGVEEREHLESGSYGLREVQGEEVKGTNEEVIYYTQ